MKHFYRGNIRIDIFKKRIFVNLEVKSSDIDVTCALFYINKNMKINNIEALDGEVISVGSEVVYWNPFFQNTVEIRISPQINIDRIGFMIQYEGPIDNNRINQISDNWTELGIYAPWFVLNEGLDETHFEIDIDFVGPIDSRLIFPKRSKVLKDIDFPIFISDRHSTTTYASGLFTVNVHVPNNIATDYGDLINDEVFRIIEFYGTQFSKIEVLECLDIVIAPRVEGGGYCRNGLIVLTPESINSMEEKQSFIHYLAHEIAHIWWNKAEKSTWEDWLNESFAEYSALVYLGDRFNKTTFENLIDSYKTKAKGLSPIYGMKRVSDSSYEILKYKGTLLIEDLKCEIGDVAFHSLLRYMISTGLSSTKDLLDYLEMDVSKNIKTFLLQRLND